MTKHPKAGPRAAILLAILAAVLFQSCASATARRNAVPADLEDQAEVTGFPPGMRYFPRDAEHVALFEKDFVESWARERAYLHTQGHDGPLPPAAYLAISGGGDNGAFGAGLLNGWTKAGTRPTFKLVTGVSTGALIAPFAFLGSAHDATLKAMYTSVSLKDIATMRWVGSAFFGDAMADTGPLAALLKKHVTQALLDEIAAEDAKGRILLVGTANLDARRAVIWNITKLAASRRPGALELVRKILLASAAIPGTFPPVMIDAHVGSLQYQEMHVDGGTASQVFVYPAAVDLEKLSADNDSMRQRTLYIIRNARLDPEWAQVDRRTLSIALRAITCLIQYQGIGDLYRIYTITKRDKVAYNLAYIPPTFTTPHTADFDPVYMGKLFDLAFQMAAEGHEWSAHPPVLLSGEGSENAALWRD
jgi:predicted acylesterase/phospholipase RssA